MADMRSALKLGSDGRIIWTHRMDIEFERVFKMARTLEPPPTLDATLEMIRKAVVEKYPQLQSAGFGIGNVRSRYNWFRRHFPDGFAVRVINLPDRQQAAIADAVDSEKRRRLEAVETLFPTIDIHERMKQLEARMAAIEERASCTLRSVAAIEVMLSQVTTQLAMICHELGVSEKHVLRILDRRQAATAMAPRAARWHIQQLRHVRTAKGEMA